MKNILYEGYLGPRLPKEVQLQRVQRVIREELTPLQRQTLLDYYFHRMTIPQIALKRGVHKSTPPGRAASAPLLKILIVYFSRKKWYDKV